MTTDTYTIQYYTRGITYNLNGFDADHGLTLNYLGDQGFGLAPLHRITTRGPLQHGDSDIDYRLDPRIIQIPIIVQNTSATPMYNSYAIRQSLLNIFRPQDTDSYIQITSTTGPQTISRRINVRVLGGLTFDVDPTEYHVRTVVQLRADDPTWYNPTSSSVSYTQANFVPSLNTITLSCNFLTFPIIGIVGPVNSLEIENIITSQWLRFANVAAGTTLTVDLRYGRKTVVNQLGQNRIQDVLINSDLATWYLAPQGLINGIKLYGSGLTAATLVNFTWNERFTGI